MDVGDQRNLLDGARRLFTAPLPLRERAGVRGWLLAILLVQLSPNQFVDRVTILPQLIIPKPHDAIPLLFEPPSALGVVFTPEGVLPAVQFCDESFVAAA